MPVVPVSIAVASASRRTSSQKVSPLPSSYSQYATSEKIPNGAAVVRQHSQPTFAEAMAQLQSAHTREVESLQKELRKMGRVCEKKAAVGAQASRDCDTVLPGAVEAAMTDLRLGQIRTCPTCGGPSDVPGARVCASCFGQSSLEWHQEACSARQSTARDSAGSRSTYDDPYTIQDNPEERRAENGESGIIWNPDGGRRGLAKFLDRATGRFFRGDGTFTSRTSAHLAKAQAWRKRRIAYRIVKSWPFAFMSYFAITTNSLFIGVRTQLEMDRAQTGLPMEKWLDYVEFGFVAFFTLELMCKVLAEDVYVFLGSDWHWNLLDMVLVVAAVFQCVFENMGGAPTPNLTPTRNIRLFRITRVLRVVKVVQACQSLRVMILSIFKSVGSLFWALVVLLVFKYLFAMLFMHGTISYFESQLDSGGTALTLEELHFWNTPQEHLDYMKYSWSSIDRSILTLFESITGGRDWGEVYYSLHKTGLFYGFMFVVYVYFMVFLVLNVVIGTVVEVTSGVAAKDRDRLVDAEMSSLKDYASDIKTFFKQADTDGSGQLSWEEFRTHLMNDRVKAYFQTLDLDIRKAHTLFSLLDTSANGEVGIEEFLDGCLRLRGQAKSLDLNLVIHQLDALMDSLSMSRKVPTGLRATTYNP